MSEISGMDGHFERKFLSEGSMELSDLTARQLQRLPCHVPFKLILEKAVLVIFNGEFLLISDVSLSLLHIA